ncbi:hypothetical protein N8Z47_05705 [Salibacteraceae bacterium]|jgi:hypothetical protein|nr:hypothetical protein [Salibacteraceae bacterium]
MNPLLRNVLAVIAGLIVGNIVNMSLIQIGYITFPIEGIDTNDMEALAAVMPTLDIQYFIFPFLAHAIGTLTGAIVTALVATGNVMKPALVIGAFFLLGGIMVSFMIPAPTWFVALDILVAYIPMAWIGGKIGGLRKQN